MFPITTRFLNLLVIIPTWILLFVLIKPIQLAPSFYEKVKAKLREKPLLAYVRSPRLLFRKEKSFQERLELLGELMRQSNLEINGREYSRTNRRLYLQSFAFRDRIVFGYHPDTDETEDQPRIYTDFDFLYVTDHNHNVVGRR